MEEESWFLLVNIIGVIGLLIALHLSIKLWMFYKQPALLWLMMACIYSLVLRCVVICWRNGCCAEIPVIELGNISYILFSLGIIGLWIVTKRTYK